MLLNYWWNIIRAFFRHMLFSTVSFFSLEQKKRVNHLRCQLDPFSSLWNYSFMFWHLSAFCLYWLSLVRRLVHEVVKWRGATHPIQTKHVPSSQSAINTNESSSWGHLTKTIEFGIGIHFSKPGIGIPLPTPVPNSLGKDKLIFLHRSLQKLI